jgi:hypothetical protein
MCCWKDRGPDFGSLGELEVREEPFNRQDACLSWAYEPGYMIPVNSEGINMLTYNENGYFTISSIEVWGVRFKD